jgi:hypothetical protein
VVMPEHLHVLIAAPRPGRASCVCKQLLSREEFRLPGHLLLNEGVAHDTTAGAL